MKINNELFSNFFLFFLIILFLVQPLSKIDYLQIHELRIRAILKIVFLLFLVITVFFLGAEKKVLYLAIGMFLCFVIGQCFLDNQFTVFKKNVFFDELISGDIYLAIKYLFIFIVIAVVEKSSTKKELIIKAISILNKIIVVNTFFILIGIVFSIDAFISYPQSPLRFGSQGLLDLAGETLYVYIIAIIINYYRFLKTKKTLMLFVSIIGASLLGKKAVFLFLGLLLLIHLWYLKKKVIYYTIILLNCLIVFFAEAIVKTVTSFSPFWKYVYEEYGLVSTIFSRRDNLLISALNYIEEYWSYINYLFGGIDYFNIRSEFGVFDLFLAFGFIGLIIYTIFIIMFFFKGQKKIVVYLLLSLLFIETLSGGLFTNITPMILFYLMAQYLKNYNI